MTTVPAATVDEVLALYERCGRERYDEEVTQLEHALQCAALALGDGAPDELVAAALLHDVGHLLELVEGRSRPTAGSDPRHEAVGAAYLARLLPPAVTRPIALHVSAKRHLCAVDPGYRVRLSDGSKASLARQGGPFTARQAAAFAARPGAAEAVALRRWDDAGKVVGLDPGSLADHAARLARLAAAPR